MRWKTRSALADIKAKAYRDRSALARANVRREETRHQFLGIGATMYAVFEDGSRQYKESEGQVVKVDYREVEPGQRVEFGRVLLYSNADDLQIGQPTVQGSRVVGE